MWQFRTYTVALAAFTVCLLGLSIAPPLPAQDVSQSGPAEVRQAETGEPTIGGNSSQAAPTEGTIPTNSLIKIMQDGGVLMYPILLCSIISLVFVFERTISLRRGRIIPDPFVKRFFHQLREGQLDRDQALRLCEENKSPVAAVFAGAVRKWGRPSVEVEQALIDAGERVTNDLRKYLRVFNGVSTVSPLLGLLGTVFGMIAAFNAIATSKALGRPELLASGIAEALLTTAFGLTVAIPALIFYWLFVSIVDRRIIEIDALGQELVNLISSDGSADSYPSKTARSRRRETTAEASRS
jgi:biopolymer transport protein ExbB